MRSKTLLRLRSAVAGGAAIMTIAPVVAGCTNGGNLAPSTTTTTPTTPTTPTTATVSPTEKVISPTGGNSFSPQVLAPPAPTEPPGVHRHGKR